jgi:hypothetical protein
VRGPLGPAALFAAALALAFSSLTPRIAWNEGSRAGLTAAVVDRGTFAIDAYQTGSGAWSTGDRARHRGHFYSDKIIGTSLLAIPGYAVAKVLAGWPAGGLPPGPAMVAMRVTAETIPGVIGGLLFCSLLVRLGTSRRRAVLGTAFAIFGTIWFAYGTALYPYVPGIAATLAAAHLALFPPERWRPATVSLAVGALLGLALLMDYAFAVVVAAVGLTRIGLALHGSRGTGRGAARAAGHALAIGAGALPSLALFASYCLVIFGQLAIPYQFLENAAFREGMARGVLGVEAPRLGPLLFVTLHPFRGLFFWSPVVVVGYAGCVLRLRDPDARRRAAAWLGATLLPAYLLLNAGYYMWWGGWAIGSRFLLPAVPFAMLGLAAIGSPTEGRRGSWPWRLAQVTGWASILLNVPLAVIGVNLSPGVSDEALARAGVGTELPLVTLDAVRLFLLGRADPWPFGPPGPAWTRPAGYAWVAIAAVATGLLLWRAARRRAPRPYPPSGRRSGRCP